MAKAQNPTRPLNQKINVKNRESTNSICDHYKQEFISDQVPILMYHSIDETGPSELHRYRISPEQFEQQITYLAENGYYSITLEERAKSIEDNEMLPGRPIIITFDDGYQNFSKYAWPILEKKDFGATLFIVSEKVGTKSDWDNQPNCDLPLMDWDELSKLSKRGLQIGSHSASHVSLLALTTEQIIEEGKLSKDKIIKELNIDANTFAFPYGHTDDRVSKAIAESGYSVAVGTFGGMSTFLHETHNLPRIEIFPEDNLEIFSEKVAFIRPRSPQIKDVQNNIKSDLLMDHSINASLKDSNMPIHPDYAHNLAAQLDKLVSDFISLHSRILLTNEPKTSLPYRIAKLFREPITGEIKKELQPYSKLMSDVVIGFENEANVILNVTPKDNQNISPNNYLNTLSFLLTGNSRWLTIEIPCQWADISSSNRFQISVYGTSDKAFLAQLLIRIMKNDGTAQDINLANVEVSNNQVHLNAAGEFKLPDFIDINCDRLPLLIFLVDTRGMPDFEFRLNYFSAYFD